MHGLHFGSDRLTFVRFKFMRNLSKYAVKVLNMRYQNLQRKSNLVSGKSMSGFWLGAIRFFSAAYFVSVSTIIHLSSWTRLTTDVWASFPVV